MSSMFNINFFLHYAINTENICGEKKPNPGDQSKGNISIKKIIVRSRYATETLENLQEHNWAKLTNVNRLDNVSS